MIKHENTPQATNQSRGISNKLQADFNTNIDSHAHNDSVNLHFETALKALASGLSTIPPKMDGSKAPIAEWKQFQKSLPTTADIDNWYGQDQTGVGLICGAVSSNLECLDFDSHQVWERYKHLAKDAGLWDLLKRIADGYSERTPNGFHLLYKCPLVEGNKKLAQAKDKKTLIETRGEGGFIIVAPSCGNVNPSGNYELKAGGFDSIVTLSMTEREALLILARSLDELGLNDHDYSHNHQKYLDKGRPGDEFIANTTWKQILEPKGWMKIFESKGTFYWRRPGKDTGISATTNHAGCDLLHVFSSSTEFDAGRSYNRFSAYTLLNYQNDFTAAAQSLFDSAGLKEIKNLTDAPQEWLKPLPLLTKIDPEPYPLDALPGSVRLAIGEVCDFTKAPIPLAVSSALAAMSLAIQAHADVKRADKLHGPSGLFLLTIADSGERKSTCDGFFIQSIREYEAKQADDAKPLIKEYMAEMESWEAKRGGIKEKIRSLAKGGKSTQEQDAKLHDLMHERPEPPRVPRLIYGDFTPEELKWSLAKNWPSGGVISSEAGLVFGSHGMGKDSVMRNLAILNQLWDGADIVTDRRTSESFTVSGARLTIGLQVQEATLRSFFGRSGVLARGTGFLARFLVAWPESTQGYRPFTEAPDNWPALEKFNQRITSILELDVPIGEDGSLTPLILPLAPDTKTAWVAFHDAIEAELRSGGELYDVRDVASKTADNAVRIATLFQLFEHGISSAISQSAFEGASRIAAWHLHEARRFYGELAIPEDQANAQSLEKWLLEYCRSHQTNVIKRREIQRNVIPGHLRQKEALDDALAVLRKANRARLVPVDKCKEINVNPDLLKGDH